MFLLSSADFLKNKLFRNTIRVSNVWIQLVLIWVQTICIWRLSADNKSCLQTICAIMVVCLMQNISVYLKTFLNSNLELWQPFCSAEQNHLCNFGRGCYEEHILWNYFKFGPMVQEMSFKRFLIWSSGSPPVRWSRTIHAILKKGHHREHSCEVIWNLDQWFRRRCHLKKKFTHDQRQQDNFSQ